MPVDRRLKRRCPGDEQGNGCRDRDRTEIDLDLAALQMVPDVLVNHENSSRLSFGLSAAAAGDRGGLLARYSEVFEDAAV